MLNQFITRILNPTLKIIDNNKMDLSKLKKEIKLNFKSYADLSLTGSTNKEIKRINEFFLTMLQLMKLREDQKDRK